MLAAKVSWREHIKRGCITWSPCLEERELPHALCPGPRIWPLFADGRGPRGYTSPPLTASKFNKTPKRIMVDAGFPSGPRYAPLFLHRGDARTACTWGVPRTASGKSDTGAGWGPGVILILNQRAHWRFPVSSQPYRIRQAAIRLKPTSALRRITNCARNCANPLDAKHPCVSTMPSDIDSALTVSAGIQYLGIHATDLREKREGHRCGSGIRKPSARPNWAN